MSFQIDKNLLIAIKASVDAGLEIMKIYEQDFDFELKSDSSPLTIADKNANEVINKYLQRTNIPIISEENAQIDYFTFASLGNSVSFGDMLSGSGISPGGTSDAVRGVWMGGGIVSPLGGTNIIQYVNIPTLGDTVDFGDMNITGGWCDACSNGHGGLG